MACKWLNDQVVRPKEEFDSDHIYDVIPSGEISDDSEAKSKKASPKKIAKVSDPIRLPLADLGKEERRQYYRLLVEILDIGEKYNRIMNGLTGPESVEQRMKKSFGFADRRVATIEKDRLFKELKGKIEEFNKLFSNYLKQPLTTEWVVVHARKRHVETIKKSREAGEMLPFWEI